MNKKNKLKEQSFSLEDLRAINYKGKTCKYDPSENLRNKKLIAGALWECILTNDIPAFKEILKGHLDAVKRNKLAKETKISKRTIYRMLSPEGNPRFSNVCKLVNKLFADQVLH